MVDNDSGLTRTPADLSGGEQFIALLAPAPGMVEMMACSRGRLEWLWLDEDFSSLDRTNLDPARRSHPSPPRTHGNGHLPCPDRRRRGEQCAAVTREVTGRRATWLDPSQRTGSRLAILKASPRSRASGLRRRMKGLQDLAGHRVQTNGRVHASPEGGSARSSRRSKVGGSE